MQYYAPGNLAGNDGFLGYPQAASIAFNAVGSEMIVSFSPELIYLFDLNNPRNDTDMMMNIPDSVTKRISGSTEYCCNVSFEIILDCFFILVLLFKNTCSHINENSASCACYYMKKASDLFNRKWYENILFKSVQLYFFNFS